MIDGEKEMENTDLLLRLGAALYRLGVQIEKKRRQVTELLQNGGRAEEVTQLVAEYELLRGQFSSLERQYQEVKSEGENR